MKYLTAFVDFVLNTSLFTAACATGLCMATERLVAAGQPPLLSGLHILVFGSTLLVYNAPRLLKRPGSRYRVSRREYRTYQLFFVIGLVMTIAGFRHTSGELAGVTLMLGLFAFAYFLPLLPFKDKKRLREFGWLKIFVLAGVWTTATSVLPILYLGRQVVDFPFEILLRLVFIFTLCIVFDIRDMQADFEHNIYTLPHKAGVRNSYRLINIMLVAFLLLSVLQFFRHPVASRMSGAVITVIATKFVVEYLRKYPSERGYNGLADGVMLIYALLILMPWQH